MKSMRMLAMVSVGGVRLTSLHRSALRRCVASVCQTSARRIASNGRPLWELSLATLVVPHLLVAGAE